ncbi:MULTISPECIES: competence/damage-inducible protein A [unclassified Lacticaseibacillus]|uniref:competence/damage-inducible protein A n=1 Tax=unclassified Lacticaseibacillus TaxID=2759744 RepID=UPI00194424D0|nr:MULTISPECIES: competence/damage-inducible protein A [unclassified Lacticaseibacillus]
MNAELIAVGTEMLLGQITNTNGAFLAKQLSELGIDSLNQQVVGDNPERLEAAIALAESRADMIFVLGGLGPTPDDLSKQTLAKHLGVALVEDAPAMAKLKAYAKQQHHEMTANNRLQAMYPAGATVLTNAVGLAVGAVLEQQGRTYVLLPGPPREFEPMVLNALVPLLLKRQGQGEVMVSRVLRFFGIGESQVVTELADLIAAQTNPTLATYIKPYEVTLRLTAKAKSEQAATALLDPLERAVQARLGEFFYGYGDNNSLAAEVVRALAREKVEVTAAESLTAGAFQAALADIPGVSAWFKGGFVTYSNRTKAKFLQLDQAAIDQAGAVSEQTAKAMAEGALKQAAADVAISFTGVAGPGPSDGIEAGTVWIGLAAKGQSAVATLHHFPGSRAAVRGRAVKAGLFTLLRFLQAAEKQG